MWRNCKAVLWVEANTKHYLQSMWSFIIRTPLLKNYFYKELAFQVPDHIIELVSFRFCSLQPSNANVGHWLPQTFVTTSCSVDIRIWLAQWNLWLAKVHLNFIEKEEEFVINSQSSVLCMGCIERGVKFWNKSQTEASSIVVMGVQV